MQNGRLVDRAVRFCWQRDRFAMYQFRSAQWSHDPIASQDIDWIGINTLARTTDRAPRIMLSANGEGMRARGDAGLLGYSTTGRLIAWVWLRSGAYVERAGCGFLKIPDNVRVVREFKVHPDTRGRGIGRLILGELGRRIQTDDDCTTIAFVAPTNLRSLRSFESAGFERVGTVETRRVAGVRLTRSLAAATAREARP